MEDFFTPQDIIDLSDVAVSSFKDQCVVSDASEKVEGGHAWTPRDPVICAASSPMQAVQTGLPVHDFGSNVHQLVFSFPITVTLNLGDRVGWTDGNGTAHVFEVKTTEPFGTYEMMTVANCVERSS